MDKCCEICGDVGVVDAIIICSECKSSGGHVYCLGNIDIDNPPKTWLCEECELGEKEVAGPSKTPNEAPRRKKIQTGKVKYLPAEEVITLNSGAKRFELPFKISGQSHFASSKALSSALHRAAVKPRAPAPKSTLQLRETPLSGNSGHLKPHRLGDLQTKGVFQPELAQPFGNPRRSEFHSKVSNRSHNVLSTKAPSSALQSTAIESRATPPKFPSQQREKQVSGPSGCVKVARLGDAQIATLSRPEMTRTFEKLKGNDVCINYEKGTSSSNAIAVTNLPKLHICDPATDASWKGSLKILTNLNLGKLTFGVQAHPPSKVRRKVYELSKLLPDVINFELVPRRSLLEDFFQDYCPSREDVGLYFFPSNSESSEDYFILLEDLSKRDLVLRKLLGDVELLLLTSKLLHIDCQKWRGKYFLWGLFHRVRKVADTAVSQGNKPTSALLSSDASASCAGQEESMVVDMEVDMIGGQKFGREDIAVPRGRLLEDPGSFTLASAPPVTLCMSPSVPRNVRLDLEMPLIHVIRGPFIHGPPPGFENRRRSQNLRSPVGNKP